MTWSFSRAFALVSVVALASLGSSRALADVSAADSAMAQALFDEGRQLYEAHKTAEACARFAQSQKLEPKLGTLLNLAQCHEDIGKIASAWVEFGSAATQARREQQKDRADYAAERVEALRQRLSRVTFHVSAPVPGMKVEIDGEAFDPDVAGAGLPLDPGDHAIVVSAPGRKSWNTVATINSELQRVDVTIPPLEALKEAPQAPRERHRDKATTRTSPLAIAGFTVGGVGIALGGITGAASLAMGAHLKSVCKNGHCSGSQASDLSTANALANVSNVSLPLGALALGLGTVAFVLDRPAPAKSDDAAPSARTELRLGVGYAGVAGSF